MRPKSKPKLKIRSVQVKFSEDDYKLLKVQASKSGVETVTGIVRVAVKAYLIAQT